MKLNRDDIIKALDILDRFDFFQGQRAGRELWNEKPFDVQEQDIAKFSQDVAWLKNYINEFTAENERLKKEFIEQNLKNIMRLETSKEIESEAYKDFAESIKKDFDNPRIQKLGLDFVKFLKKLVDNKLQEMKGND